jgi:hypothetical protein
MSSVQYAGWLQHAVWCGCYRRKAVCLSVRLCIYVYGYT